MRTLSVALRELIIRIRILLTGVFGAAFGLSSIYYAWAAAGEPPKEVASLTLFSDRPSLLTEAGQSLGHQSSDEVNLSWLRHQPLPWTDWYWGGGLCADTYAFHNDGGFGLHRLQDVAAQFSLEYYVHNETAFSVTVRPGLYFENHPGLGGWDIPVEAVGGIPCTTTLSGVLGVMDARYYRHPIPVIGMVWIASKAVRVEAVFPEPAFIVTFSPQIEGRLAGELVGGGFRTDARPGRQTVEYSSYRIGGSLSYRLSSRCKLTGGAGSELERTFDFLHENRRVRAAGAPYCNLSLELTR
jgi:hypothetical protein